LLVNYESAEHTVFKGELVEFVREWGGWILCRNREGKLGWLSSAKLEKVKSEKPPKTRKNP